MVFSSVTFLFYFLPIFLTCYWLVQGITAKNLVLFVASIIFYAWGEPSFVVLLLALIATNYLIGILIDVCATRTRGVAVAVGVAINLGVLGIFKYADFVVQNLNSVLKAFNVEIPVPGVALPIGISFIVFHSISYLVDIYRHKVSANRNPLEVGVYLAMFPQLVAGPIIRYHTIAHRIRMRSSTVGRASAGIRIFIIGLAQKVLIADEIARVADTVFDRVVAPTFFEAWLGVSAYTLQIYFDFSGYSNMAIGLAILLGLNFPRNFRMPYRSRSVTEFWRRWHITLSSWFRDYVYIPLGGSRGSRFQTYSNLVAVFLLCGLWHGASVTFVIWGLHHGLFLIAERAGFLRWISAMPRSFAIAYTLLAVMTGWVWFRARDLERAAELFGAMVGLNGFGTMSIPVHMALDPKTLILLVVGATLALWRMPRLASAHSPLAQQRLMAAADTTICAVFFCLCALAISAGSYSPFLYFRF